MLSDVAESPQGGQENQGGPQDSTEDLEGEDLVKMTEEQDEEPIMDPNIAYANLVDDEENRRRAAAFQAKVDSEEKKRLKKKQAAENKPSKSSSKTVGKKSTPQKQLPKPASVPGSSTATPTVAGDPDLAQENARLSSDLAEIKRMLAEKDRSKRGRGSSDSSDSSSSGDATLSHEEVREKRRRRKKARRREHRESQELMRQYLKQQAEAHDRTAAATEKLANQSEKNSSAAITTGEEEPDMDDKSNWTTGTFTLEDDGMTPEKLHWGLRLSLRPPNSAPSTWWTREFIKELETKPVRGVSMMMEHIAGKNR